MDNIIKAEDYQGTSIYDALISSGRSEEIIRETIANNLRKGLITHDQFNKANAQLDDLIKAGKKTGAGSRGGHVIGYTKSGKPVYKGKEAGHKDNKDFSAQDHLDAAEVHNKEAYQHNQKGSQSNHPEHSRYHLAMMQHHRETGNSHQKQAHSQIQKEHESGLSADEKKIIAAQKKKQIDLHDRYAAYYSNLALEAKKMSDMEDVAHEHQQRANHHKSEKERLEKE